MTSTCSTGQTLQHSIAKFGFAILPGVFSADAIAMLLRSLADLDCRRSRAGIRHILGHPAVSAVARDARMLRIAQAILGDGAFPFRATLFDKSPEANWLIAWHQDTALPLTQKRETTGWGP